MSPAGRCACGGGCPRCVTPASAASTPALEAEADQVAEHLVTSPPPARSALTPIERMAAPSSLAQLLGHSEPLPQVLRARFEAHTGLDLGSVRIHRDRRANATTSRHDANALAAGTHIAFAPSMYAPTTKPGQRLIAHEVVHVIQQALQGRPRVQLDRRRRRPQATAELTGLLRLLRDDAETGELISQLVTAVQRNVAAAQRIVNWADPAYDQLQRQAAALTNAVERLESTDYSAASMVTYHRRASEVLATCHAIILRARRGEAPELLAEHRAAGSLLQRLRERPVIDSYHEQRASERDVAEHRAEEAAQQDYPRIARELRAFFRDEAHRGRRMRILYGAPSLLVPATRQFLRERMGTSSQRFQRFFEYLQRHDTWLYYAIQLDGRLVPDLRRWDGLTGLERFQVTVLGDWQVGLIHVVLGEWENDPYFEESLTNPARGERYEVPWAAYAADLVLGVVPYLGTALDVRDIVAIAFALAREYGSPETAADRETSEEGTGWRRAFLWIRLVLSGVGIVPVVGDGLKIIGRLLMRAGRAARLTSTVNFGRVVNQLERQAPEVLELLESIGRVVGDGWDAVVARVTTYWNRIVEALATRMRPFNAALAAALERVKRATPTAIPQAFASARRLFEEVVVELRNMTRWYGETAYAALVRARRLVRRLSADGRMANALDDFQRLDAALLRALASGDQQAIARALEDLHDFTRVVDEAQPAEAAGDVAAVASPRTGRIHGPGSGRLRRAASQVRRAYGELRDRFQRVLGTRIPEDGISIHGDLDDAQATYRRWIARSSGREAGIFQSASTGEYVVVQGSGDWVNGAVNFPTTTERWIPIAHYHPELNPLTQYASRADFAAIVHSWGGVGAIRSRVSSRIDLVDPLTGRHIESHFGYDPQAIAPYFVDVELPNGRRIEYSFESLEDLQRHYQGVRADSDIVRAAPRAPVPPGHTPPSTPIASPVTHVGSPSRDPAMPPAAPVPHLGAATRAVGTLEERLAGLAQRLDRIVRRAERRFLDELAELRGPRTGGDPSAAGYRYTQALRQLQSQSDVELVVLAPHEEVALLREIAASGTLNPAQRGSHLSTRVRGGSAEGSVFLNVGSDGRLSLARIWVAGAGQYETTIPAHIRRLEAEHGVGEAIRALSPSRRRLVFVVEPARRTGTYAAMRIGEELARATSGTSLERVFAGDLAPLAFRGANRPDAAAIEEFRRRLVRLLAEVVSADTRLLRDRGGRHLRNLAAAIERFARTGDAGAARALEDRIVDLLRFFHGQASHPARSSPRPRGRAPRTGGARRRRRR